MTRVFVDTSYFIALLRARDEHNARATAIRKRFAGPFVTTEFVIVELLDALSTPQLRGAAAAAADQLRTDSATEVVPASSKSLQAGLELYRAHADKGWGITDCISFAVMQRLQIRDALTADRHFEQAGFRALLR